MPTKKVIKEFIQCSQRQNTARALELLAEHPDLITATASAPPKKYDGQSMLQIALRRSSSEIAIALIDAGADVNFMEVSEINSRTAPLLHHALIAVVWATLESPEKLCEGTVAALRHLLEAGADPNCRDSRKIPAFLKFLDEARRRADPIYFTYATSEDLNKLRHIRRAHDLMIEYGVKRDYTRFDGKPILSAEELERLGILNRLNASALVAMDTNQEKPQRVWVFLGEGAVDSAAVFSSLEHADAWIATNVVSGILTAYPLDQSVYDWTIEQGYFQPKQDYQRQPKFIGSFSSAYAEHYHYEEGRRIA